jgi:hypothetical protein
MTAALGPRIEALYRYPVKGLSPEPLAEVHLAPGATMPFDRTFAIENGPGRFDPDSPRHLPKINFLMLMRDERLAGLATRFEDATATLIIHRDGRQVAQGALTSRIGRQMLEQFFAAYMKGSLRGPPRIVTAPGHSFSDVAAKCLHIINLASLRELERALGRTLEPLRFRANLHLDGLPAFEERRWLDRDLRLGGVKVTVFDRTGRCEATNVNPRTAARDAAIPQLLQRTYGHTDFGVYAKVTGGGRMAAGDTVEVL